MLIDHGWTQLEQEFRALMAEAQGRLCYVPNPGNAGDALIAVGTWQFFDQMGVAPTVTAIDELRGGDVVVFAGGGNLVPNYSHCRGFLSRCLQVGVGRVLILPHSVRGHEDILNRLDGRFTIACREHETAEHVRTAASGARSVFAPDMALRIDVASLNARCRVHSIRKQLYEHLHEQGRLLKYLRWRLRLLWLARQKREVFRVIRADVEAHSQLAGRKDWDISSLYGSPYWSRNEAEFVSRDLLEFLRKAPAVVTNRLHVGIAAALVGTRVTLMDNSYGKISSVYKAWLSGLKGVDFIDQPRSGSAETEHRAAGPSVLA